MQIPDYTITTLNQSPSMNRTKIPFMGTFAEATAKAIELWIERPMSLPSVHSRDNTTHWYFTIRENGEWVNRNTVPEIHGRVWRAGRGAVHTRSLL